jgi:hypothetical protein
VHSPYRRPPRRWHSAASHGPRRLNFFVVDTTRRRSSAPRFPPPTKASRPKWKGRIGIEATDSEWMAAIVKKWARRKAWTTSQARRAKPDMRKARLAQLVPRAKSRRPHDVQRQHRIAEEEGRADRLRAGAAVIARRRASASPAARSIPTRHFLVDFVSRRKARSSTNPWVACPPARR